MRIINARNQAILSEMVRTDFKIRYQGSALGYMWSLLKPLFIFAILYIVFTYIIPLGKGISHYPVYLLMGIIFWNFFVESTVTGTSSVVSKGDLIRKINIPRYLTVISSSFSALINLLLSMIVVFIFAVFNGIHPNLGWLLIILLIAELFAFSLFVSFFLSALYVKFRDVSYIWEIFLQAGFYTVPILYSITSVPLQYRKYLFIDPITQVIQDARHLLIGGNTPTIWSTVHSYLVFVPFLIIVLSAFIGILYFKKEAKLFAENI